MRPSFSQQRAWGAWPWWSCTPKTFKTGAFSSQHFTRLGVELAHRTFLGYPCALLFQDCLLGQECPSWPWAASVIPDPGYVSFRLETVWKKVGAAFPGCSQSVFLKLGQLRIAPSIHYLASSLTFFLTSLSCPAAGPGVPSRLGPSRAQLHPELWPSRAASRAQLRPELAKGVRAQAASELVVGRAN